MATILIIGTGTIGEPLIGLFCTHAKDFGIDEILFHKRTPLKTDRSKVLSLQKRGALLCVDKSTRTSFRALGIEPKYTLTEAMNKADVVIDCTPCGNKNKEAWYRHQDWTKGFIAQGSEKGFGKPYAFGINDSALMPEMDRYIQVVSCNTHNLAAIIQVLAATSTGYNGIREANFLCIRRANDISQVKGFMPSPTVGGHNDKKFGTHHAADAHRLLSTNGHDVKMFSSALKLNTQYMHTIYFNIEMKDALDLESIQDQIDLSPRIAWTHKKSANEVFSFGRDHGHYGRILNQTVFCLPSLSVVGNKVVGFCFTPQDGNSLVSSVASALWLLDPDGYKSKLSVLYNYFFNEI